MNPKISVIIPTYNRALKLEKNLQALKKQTLSKNDFEIIIVDDGSGKETQELLKKFQESLPQLNWIHKENGGAASARNLALQKAKGEIVLFLDDDVYASPDLLEHHFQFHQKNPEKEKTCLGYLQWTPNEEITPLMKWMTEGWKGPLMDFHNKKSGDLLTFWHFYTANLSVKKNLLQDEKFNEGFHSYGWEDTELAYRLWKKKNMKLIFVKEALAYHDHFMDLENFKQRMEKVGKSAVYFESLHPELNVIPKGFRKVLLALLSSRIHLFIWEKVSRICSKCKALYWYLLSKRYFLKGVKSV